MKHKAQRTFNKRMDRGYACRGKVGALELSTSTLVPSSMKIGNLHHNDQKQKEIGGGVGWPTLLGTSVVWPVGSVAYHLYFLCAGKRERPSVIIRVNGWQQNGHEM